MDPKIGWLDKYPPELSASERKLFCLSDLFERNRFSFSVRVESVVRNLLGAYWFGFERPWQISAKIREHVELIINVAL